MGRRLGPKRFRTGYFTAAFFFLMAYTYEELIAWNMREQVYPMPNPAAGPIDYHRAQVERWLWDNRDRMAPPVVDIGAEWRREYAGSDYAWTRGPRYLTLNLAAYDTSFMAAPDVVASITQLPFADSTLGTILCTETLEHVANLFKAVAELKRVLRPGGWVFVTTPFYWPVHESAYYGDYWRLTERAYRFLFSDFAAVQVQATELRLEARAAQAAVMRWEVMGVDGQNALPTGYMVAARK